MEKPLKGRTILITGAARRLGRFMAIGVAQAGADVIVHFGHSTGEAKQLQEEIGSLGVRAFLLQADLEDERQAADLIRRAGEFGNVFGIINNAAIFESLTVETTDLDAWHRHLAINLTAPFLLCQAFARQVALDHEGCIVNIIDWRALRPMADHFPYTISKAALAAMTKSLAVALAPRIRVNGLALGAILPPTNGRPTSGILSSIPAGRWANIDELIQALIFLLSGPAYITGEIIHLDGGRHLV